MTVSSNNPEYEPCDYNSKKFIDSFMELNRKRRNLVSALVENNRSTTNILNQIYDDKGHFVYELLQNAEDAHATTVILTVSENGVELEHDGKKQFHLNDIEAITNIGRSTKITAFNSIGKFGIGFRSVYRYTSNPYIHLRGFSFQILEEEIPEITEPETEWSGHEYTTKFVLPFDHSKCDPLKAKKEVQEYIQQMTPAPLLFLQHIKNINIIYKTKSCLDRQIELTKSVLSEFHVKLKVKKEDIIETEWVVLSEKMGSEITGGLQSRLNVAVAFRLNNDKKYELDQKNLILEDSGETKSFEYKATQSGKLFVYFPAVREETGLNFYIHAPFISTPARDAIARNDDNNINSRLIDQLLNLIIKKIPELIELKMFNKSFLRLLPIPSDKIDDRFQKYQKEIVHKFKKLRIIESDEGSLVYPTNCIRVDNKVAEIFSADKVKFVLNLPPVIREIREDLTFLRRTDVRLDSFYQSLNIPFFGVEELRSRLTKFNAHLTNLPFKNDWKNDFIFFLRELNLDSYKLLIKILNANVNLKSAFSVLPIVMVENATIVDFVSPMEAFFPTTEFPNGRNFVSPRLGDFTKRDFSNSVLEFFSVIGVREFNAWDDLKISLELWGKERKINKPVIMNDKRTYLKEFLRIINVCGSSEDKLRTTSGYPILLAELPDGTVSWQIPSNIFLDNQENKSGLSNVYPYLPSHYRKIQLWTGYDEVPNLAGKVSALGVTTRINVEKNPNGDWLVDWCIPWVDEALKLNNHDFMEKLWELVTSAESERNSYHLKISKTRGGVANSQSSNLAQKLRNSSWIPNLEGKLCKPSEIDRSTLHPRFRFRDCAFLKEIKFSWNLDETKLEEAKRVKEKLDKDEKARSFGFNNSDIAEKLAMLYKRDPLEIDRLLNAIEDPINTPRVNHPEMVIDKVRNVVGAAPELEIETISVGRRKDYPEKQAERKKYLKHQYSSENGIKCQICQEISFKKVSNGEDYFIAAIAFVEINNDLEFNGLALCASCDAKYHYGTGKSSLIAFKQKILDIELSRKDPVVKVYLEMLKRIHYVHFSEEHFLSLKTQLEMI